MKNYILVLALALPTMAVAEEPANDAQLLIGMVKPTTQIEGAMKDDMGEAGLHIGGRVMHRLDSIISVGGELSLLAPGEANSSVLLTNANTTSKVSSVLFLAEMRVRRSQGSVRPWGIAGLGGHSTSLKIEGAPRAGFVWSDTGTRETRTGIDSSKAGIAFTAQAGLDFIVSDRLTMGVAGAWYGLGKTTYDATPAGRTIGLTGVEGGISYLGLTGNVAYRF